jgi:hypothetical protein
LRRAFGLARILVAITGVVALLGDINYSIGTSPFATYNFFSYFTVQSMILAIVVLVLAAVYALRTAEDPLWLDKLRLLSTTYVVVSGIVFAVILIEGALREIPVWAPWSSQLLHFWIPAFILVDWFTAPGKDVPWRTIRWVLIFPVVWVVFTMIRGTFVYWYPYFFLDPSLVAVPFEYGLYLVVIVAIFTGITALLITISRVPPLERLRERWGREAGAEGDEEDAAAPPSRLRTLRPASASASWWARASPALRGRGTVPGRPVRPRERRRR